MNKVLFIPLRENHERKLVDESEELSLRRDSALATQARGEDTATVRSWSFIIIAVVILIGAGYFWMQNTKETKAPTTQTASQSKTEVAKEEASVTIEGFKFSPTTVKIKVGGKVTWTNNDSVSHTATADDGGFNTGMIEKGESKSVTFEKAGIYAYHCTPHPYMKATVVVE